MKRYAVLVRGDNLLLNIDGEHRRCGFTTTRYLQAADAAQAGKTALIEVRQHPALKERLFDAGRILPRIGVETIVEIGRIAFWRKRRADRFEFSFDSDETPAAPERERSGP